MNTIVNDKLLSHSTHSNASHESKKSVTLDDNQEVNQSLGQKAGKDDNLDLSAAGQLMNQAAMTQTDISRSLPETAEQASALAAKIRQQFEQMSNLALSAHSGVQHNQIDLLRRSASA